MVPASIRRLLDRLCRRDRSLAVVRGLACAVALAAGALVLGGLVDWLVDRWIDTPAWLYGVLLALQGACWLAALAFIAGPLLKRYRDDELALWIERRVPSLGQRLIAAVQLNRDGADTRGMSRDLITAVTRQAERQAERVNVAEVRDNSPLKQAGLIGAPALIVAGMLLYLAPDTCAALLARLFGGEAEIPRSLHLQMASRDVWPAGEEGVLRFLAVGAAPGERTRGVALIQPEFGPSFRIALLYEGDSKEGTVFSGRVPPSEVPFACRAWLVDGRLRQPGRVRYEPRPVAKSVQSWVQLPARLGKKRDGTPFEEPQKGGDLLYRLPDAKGRLLVTAQTELTKAWVEVIGTEPRRVPLRVEEKTNAAGTFAFRPGDSAFEVHLIDTNGFECIDRPRRAIRALPLEPPDVQLLPETFWREGDSGSPEEREVEGIPILRTADPKVGRRFRLDYRCEARYGLSHVRLRYHVIPAGKEADADAGKIDRDAFHILPLGPPRDPNEPASDKAREEFSTLPVRDPDVIPDTQGKGRYDFNIDGIPDGKGGKAPMKEGDRIQFYVEVFGKADPEGRPGRSVIREKEVVGPAAYLIWLEKKDDLKERTRFLEEEQRKVRPGETGR